MSARPHLSTEQIARYQRKAQIVLAAWGALFGVPLSLRALARIMAVAEHESHMGDAKGSWTGEHNWGAIHKRALSADEKETLRTHNVAPTGGEAALLSARALLSAGPNEALHIDVSPETGPYFVWFWAFPNDIEAVKTFLRILLVQRPSVHAAIEEESPSAFARAMYTTHYYEGHHRGDPEANIRDYARRLAEIESQIAFALDPRKPPPPFVSAAVVPSASNVGVVLLLSAAFVLFGSMLMAGARR